ncbi:MAG: hypothetical protein K8R87_05260 [Verrucomicrobia bacterium]|nr:hypothetical protein [Verrucomicrobiota bacterium]
MRFSLIKTFCLMALAVSFSALNAQVAPAVKVEVKDIKPQDQRTPQFQAAVTKEHIWRPKVWLEIDMELDVKKAKTATDNTTMVDGQGKWWEDLSKFAVVDGEILPKLKTPFATLWGDYDVDVKVR